MVAPVHHRITFHGTFGPPATAVEKWSFGVSIGGLVDQDKAELDTLAADLLTRYTALQPIMTNAVYFTGIKVALRSPSAGRLVTPRDQNGAYIQGEYIHTAAQQYQGQGAVAQPFHNALAITMQSLASGASGRGRFYLPCPNVAVAMNDGLINTAAQTTVVTAARDFLVGVQSECRERSVGADLVVASGGSVAKGLPGALHRINQVKVGRVIDVQTRRTNDQTEAYVTLPVPF